MLMLNQPHNQTKNKLLTDSSACLICSRARLISLMIELVDSGNSEVDCGLAGSEAAAAKDLPFFDLFSCLSGDFDLGFSASFALGFSVSFGGDFSLILSFG